MMTINTSTPVKYTLVMIDRYNIVYNDGMNGELNYLPDTCPFCHEKGTPDLLGNNLCVGNILTVVFSCPSASCFRVFLAYYKKSNTGYLSFDRTMFGFSTTKEFHESIKKVSPNFVTIYNQALNAEDQGLDQICGVGYRKALEYLIKDFTTQNNSDKESEIKSEPLAKVIENYIASDKIKKVAARAVWLGNDETHYVRKWDEKDLGDLKKLIALTLTFIESESEFAELMLSMPEGKK